MPPDLVEMLPKTLAILMLSRSLGAERRLLPINAKEKRRRRVQDEMDIGIRCQESVCSASSARHGITRQTSHVYSTLGRLGRRLACSHLNHIASSAIRGRWRMRFPKSAGDAE